MSAKMIVTIKTLQQATFKIELEETDNVKTLKEKIEEEKGKDFPAEYLKLIYGGKILDDTQPLSKYKIQPANFVVVMVSKPRAPPPKPAPEETSEATTSEETSTTEQETATPEVAMETTQPATETTTSEGGATSETTPTQPAGTETTDASRAGGVLLQAGSTLATGSELESATTSLMGLGYPRDLVTRALNASFNNPDRAAIMLMENSVPEAPLGGMEAPQEGGEQPSRDNPPVADQPSTEDQEPAGSSQPPPVVAEQPAPAVADQPAGNRFAFLRDRPQFAQLAQLIRSDPRTLEPLMQQLGQTNPDLFQMITNHQQEFIALLNDPSWSTSSPSDEAPPPSTPVIQVTREEKEAIDRLKALGFAEADVLQAYFACEKNEEMAADFLLSDN